MADELTIESIASTVQSADDLTPEQTTFLTENAAKLTDEQADLYGINKPPVIPEPPAVVPPVVPAKKEGEEDIDDEDEKKISAIVDKRMKSLSEQQLATAITVKVDSFIGQNAGKVADINVYRDAMVKYASHPHYQNLSALEIFRIVAGDELMRIGARKEREAAKKAAETRTNSNGGSRPSGGGGGKKVDWNTASAEELHKKQMEVLGRPVS